MKKNDIFELEIDGLTNEGMGIGRHEGMAAFVPFTAPGDRILCRAVKVNKNYLYAKTEKILSPSGVRIEPSCECFTKCGGCDFLHIEYEEELRQKEKFVKDAFRRIAGMEIKTEPIITAGITEGYRNKAQYPVREINGAPCCGFFSERSHRLIECDNCRLQPEIFGKITSEIIKYQKEKRLSCYDEITGKGLLRHIYLRRGYRSGEIMLCLVVSKNTSAYNFLAGSLKQKFPEIKTAVLNINPEKTNVILGEKNVPIIGDGVISDEICGLKVSLSPHSFYQVNTAAAELIYERAGRYLDLKGGETVLDLYCGAGTIGLSLAKNAGRIIGAEIVEEAVENAKENAAVNNIGNAEFFAGDAGDIAKKLAEDGVRPDAVILDPPRKGCDQKTLDAAIKMGPEKIVMISCNPATAARDIKYLSGMYEPVIAAPADMFPRTRHVETVCLLSKLNVNQHIEV